MVSLLACPQRGQVMVDSRIGEVIGHLFVLTKSRALADWTVIAYILWLSRRPGRGPHG
jgi:hypothetical protein